jgi:hypothetical protein
MATLTATNPTLLDVLQAVDGNGDVLPVGEMLNQTNEMLDDMTMLEANQITGHTSVIRTGIPEPTFRKLYGGIQPSKTTRAQITDTVGMLENLSEVDADLADMAASAQSFMLSEARGIVEGFNQKTSRYIFSGNEATEPEAFTGFGPRFNSTSAENGENIILGGGSGSDNTSVWLVVWSPETTFGFYPKGSKAGLRRQFMGRVFSENIDGSNGKGFVYREHFKWDLGLCVKNWQYIVRVANIDRSDLTKNAASGADLIDLMTQALDIPPSLNIGRAAFYCNRSIKSFLRRQLVNKVANSTLSIETVAGKRVLMFGEVPVRRCDQILNTEATIS